MLGTDLRIDRDNDRGVPGQMAAARLGVGLKQAVHVSQELHHPLISRPCTPPSKAHVCVYEVNTGMRVSEADGYPLQCAKVSSVDV